MEKWSTRLVSDSGRKELEVGLPLHCFLEGILTAVLRFLRTVVRARMNPVHGHRCEARNMNTSQDDVVKRKI